MAGNFNLTAQIHLQAPNAKQFARNLQKQLQNPNISVNLQNAPKTVKDLNNVAKATKNVEKASRRAAKGAEYMGSQLGSAFKQIMKYDIARRVFSLFADAIESGVRDAIAFERAMVKVAQVSGATTREMKILQNAISGVATSLGVSSSALAKTSLILKQTGLSMKDTRIAMQALAKTELAPTFDNIADTAEMAVAAMRQFGLEASKLEGLLGKINTVAGNFAVESSDIGVAIRRAGGAFKAAGGEVEQLIALFTSVRSTTRETAETIATGFRTIFTRLQRPTTIKFLQQFGIELTDLSGKFVGPYEAIKRLNGALKNLDPRDLRYSMIVEQLGGFRQVSKVIPLIQQFGTAQAALNMQQAESGSLARDAAKAQETLAVKMQKLNEEVKQLFREIVGSDAFQMMASGALKLAGAIVKVADALAPIIPLMAAFGGMKIAGFLGGSMKMFGGRGIMASTGSMGGTGGPGFFNRGGRVRRFSQGGWVPGSGNGDTVPAMLEPGEFVLRKSAAQAFGPQLASVNRYAKGGNVSYTGEQLKGGVTVNIGKRIVTPKTKAILAKLRGEPSVADQMFNSSDKISANINRVDVPYTVGMAAKGRKVLSNPAKSGPTWEKYVGKYLGVASRFKDPTYPIDFVKGKGVYEAKKGKWGVKDAFDKLLRHRISSETLPPGWTAGTNKQNIGRLNVMVPGKKTIERAPLPKNKGGLVPSLLTPGEFVVNKESAQKMGYGKLSKMNRFASGGSVGVRRYAGGGGVLPPGMGGGMDPMMMMMMFEGLGTKVKETTKGFGSLIGGLTNAGMGATMAYTKFQFAAQGAGALGSALGLGGEKLDAFVGRVGQVGGIISAITNLISNPAAIKAVKKGFGAFELALLTMGDKIPGVIGKVFKKAGSGGMRGAANKSFFSIPSHFKKGRQNIADSKKLMKGSTDYADRAKPFIKQEKALNAQRKKIADQMADIAKSRAAKKVEQQAAGKSVGYWTRDAQKQAMGSGARKTSFSRARAAQTQGVFAKKEIAKLDVKYQGLSKNLSKVDDSLKVASKGAAKFTKKSANMAKTAVTMAKVGKAGIKTALALSGVGLAAIAAEETLGWIGRSMKEEAMTKIADSGGKMTKAQEKDAVAKAGTGGGISGAAMGAGIGGLALSWLGPIGIGVGAAVGAAIGGLWGWYNATVEAEKAIDRVKFGRAVEEMTDTMNRHSKGVISDSLALSEITQSNKVLQDVGGSGGVDYRELSKQKELAKANARMLTEQQFAGSTDFAGTAASSSIQEARKAGLITQEFIDSQEEVVNNNIEQKAKMDALAKATKDAEKELRALRGFGDVIREVSSRMMNYSDSIGSVTGAISSRLGDQSRGLQGNMRDPASIKRRGQAYASLGNIAGEGNAAFVSGAGLGRFKEKAEDVDFLEGNLKDVLSRSSISGGLDSENRRGVIAEELRSSLENEGHTLSDYMDKRIKNITRGLSDEDLTDIEGNMDKIYDQYMEGAEEFKKIFKDASDLVNKYNKDLASAYETQLKLEKEYTQRQAQLMQARFDSEQKFLSNLSASEFSGPSNAAIQGNFKAQQQLIANQGGLRGGTGVNEVGANFKQISKELVESNKALQDIGLDAGNLDPNDPLIQSNSELIKKNKELQQEYDSAKTILENYANSQARLTALNKELEQAQAKRKSLKDLAIQARYGTAEEKDQAARLINAITIASQQGIDAVAPDMQRQVIGYLPTLMGAQGENIINQGINDAYGGGQGIAGITEVSAEERRLATEIKAIEDAGITAGEHLAGEVGDRIKEMASEIERINNDFISEFRNLTLQREERMAKDDVISAEKRKASADKDAELLAKYGIEDKGQLTAIRKDAEHVMSLQEKQDEAKGKDPGVNIRDMATFGGAVNFGEALDRLENMGSGTDVGAFDTTYGDDLLNTKKNHKYAQQMVDFLGLNQDQFEDALGEGVFGGNATFGEQMESGGDYSAGVFALFDSIKKRATEMGMDASQLDNYIHDDATVADIMGNMFKAMAEYQENTTQGEQVGTTMENLEKNLGPDHPMMKALKAATTDEDRQQIRDDIAAMKDIQSPQAVAERQKEANDDLSAARDHLQNVQQDINTLATKGANPGSIYTHDIHCQAVLLNILSVLEGQGRTVDMGSSAAKLQKGGVDAMASSIKGPMGVQATKGIMMSGAMGQEATANFMGKYGGMSLKDIENMSEGDKGHMLEAMKNANIPETQRKELERMAGSQGMGENSILDMSAFRKSSFDDRGLSENTALKDALEGLLDGGNLGSSIVKALSEGTAAGAVAAQTQEALAQLGINETAEMFSKNIEEFSSAMGNALSIEVGGSIEVNVNMNGADFLKNAEGALAEIAGSEASKAINNFIQQMNKSSNVKQNPQGWHQSGQPKPLTGNG